jgi:hypothetical protein
MPAHIALVGGLTPPKNSNALNIFTYIFFTIAANPLCLYLVPRLLMFSKPKLRDFMSFLRKCQRVSRWWAAPSRPKTLMLYTKI